MTGAGSIWTNNGTLNIGQNIPLFDGDIGGSGLLTISDGGLVNVTGSTILADDITLNGAAGTLNIGEGATAGILNTTSVHGGGVAGSAVINFNHTDTDYHFTHTGLLGGAAINITGNTVVNHIGTGKTTLAGTNSYTGVTTINNGTLALSGGAAIHNTGSIIIIEGALDIDTAETIGSLTGAGIVNLNAALTVGNSGNTTYSGDIQGSGGFTKQGSGSTNLTGINTYSGATTINAGTLYINGSNSTSTTTVNNGGTLGGSGTVGSVIIASGGIFAPGNSIGTIDVAGNVDFSGGGIYQVEVDAAGNSDFINATGTATLSGGVVEILPEAGAYNFTTDYTILTATSGLIGTFDNSSIDSNFAFLTPALSYDSNNVFLNLTRNDVSFSGVAATF